MSCLQQASQKEHLLILKDFIGKNNVLEELNNPSKKIIGLNLIQKEPQEKKGDSVFLGNDKIGIITSGSISPLLWKE